MLNALVVVLRETLEASFLISLLIIYTRLANINRGWFWWTLLCAASVSYFLAKNMTVISDWHDGTGQEILFASLLFQISIGCILLNLLIYARIRSGLIDKPIWLIPLLMISCILAAISIEGSEVIIYFESASQQAGGIYRATIGSLLGAGIGFSLGIVAYYSIGFFRQYQIYIVQFLLALVSAGMLNQSIDFLSQAGLVEQGSTLWNSNSLISEDSLFGQLLYALLGYESTPTTLQVQAFAVVISVTLLGIIAVHYFVKDESIEDIF